MSRIAAATCLVLALLVLGDPGLAAPDRMCTIAGRLDPPASVSLTVLDPHSPLATGRSDAGGRFTLHVPISDGGRMGWARLVAHGAAGSAITGKFPVEPGAIDLHSIRLHPPAEIRILIRDPDGKAVPDAVVRGELLGPGEDLELGRAAPFGIRGKADKSGVFRRTDLPARPDFRLRLRVSHPRFAPVDLPERTLGETVALRCDLNPGRLVAGRLLTKDGAPVADAKIECGGRGTSSDGEGRFLLLPTALAAATLLVSDSRAPARFAPLTLDVPESAADRTEDVGDVVLPEIVPRPVRVTTADGSPLAGVVVFCMRAAVSDHAGRCRVGVPAAGPATVLLHAEDWTGRHAVLDGEIENDGVLVAIPRTWLELHAPAGEQLGGVEIRLDDEPQPNVEWSGARFRIEVEPGPHRITLAADGELRCTDLQVDCPAGRTTECILWK